MKRGKAIDPRAHKYVYSLQMGRLLFKGFRVVNLAFREQKEVLKGPKVTRSYPARFQNGARVRRYFHACDGQRGPHLV